MSKLSPEFGPDAGNQMLVGNILHASANRAPNRIALIGRGKRLIYAEFEESANRLANALIDLRLKKGAKVAVLSTNRPEYAIAYFGIARTPCISVHCSTRSTASDLGYVLERTDAEVLIFEAKFAPTIRKVLPRLGRKPFLIRLDRSPGLESAVLFDDFIGESASSLPEESLDDRDGLAITFTGGTTGHPKAVLVSHRARCASAVAAAQEFGLSEDDIVIASTPLFHTAGLFVWFQTAVLQGATVVLPEAWDVIKFMQAVEDENVTAAFLVPSQLNDLVTHPEFSAERLKSLRNIGYAGAPMSRALFDRVRSMLPGVSFTENYGQSEACPITIRCEKHGEEKFGTVGKAACNAEIGVVDAEGKLLPAGQLGDIVTRGVQLFDEYYKDPDETAAAFRLPDGWLLTGDVGWIDEDGFLTLVDRSKDMLISGAENVYPVEIENALYEHAAVAECAVFGIPHDRWGEVPAAHVVLSSDAAVSEDELIEFCATKIARFKRPRLIRFVASLPKTPVGKVRKNELREPYWKGRERRI